MVNWPSSHLTMCYSLFRRDTTSLLYYWKQLFGDLLYEMTLHVVAQSSPCSSSSLSVCSSTFTFGQDAVAAAATAAETDAAVAGLSVGFSEASKPVLTVAPLLV